MTGRAVPIWIGATPDSKVPDAVKLRIWTREGGRCGITKRKITPADEYDFDHKVPLSMGGSHSEDNLWPVLRAKHREKTAAEAGIRAKADRIAKKHAGIKERKPGGFRGWRKFSGEAVWREDRS